MMGRTTCGHDPRAIVQQPNARDLMYLRFSRVRSLCANFRLGAK